MTTAVTPAIVTITPEIASRMLDMNTDNRKVRSTTVARYARDMVSGAWELNGETIKVASDGTVLDGQHRLLACKEAGVPFSTLIVQGLNHTVRETMDTGMRRTMADTLRWRGETDGAALGTALETAMCWDKSGTPSHRGSAHSNAERLAYLADNSDIRDAVRLARGISGSPLKFPMSVGSAFIMRANRIAPEETRDFLHLLKTGANMTENHPVLRLRGWVLRAASAKGQLDREEWGAVLIKAWNAWLAGREVKQLSFRSHGTKNNAESFPTMFGPDGRSYEEWLESSKHKPFVPASPFAEAVAKIDPTLVG